MTADIWVAIVFYAVAILAIVGAVRMVTEPNMIRSALSLVLSLAGIAVMYVLLSADFLAVVQVLVYVGAIMILMLFAIMLTPGQVELTAVAERGQQAAAAITAVAVGVIALFALLSQPWRLSATPLNASTVEALSLQLFTTYVLPFEIAAVLLTAAMIGAIVIARED